MKFPFLALLIVSVAFSAGCAHQPASKPPHVEPVLLISIDGYRADYIDRHLSPTLEQLARTGVHAQAMEPSFPSLTFPNHYTLVTGLRPDHHGIVNNNMRDPKLGSFSLGNREAVADRRWWDEATPLWETARRAGLKSATMFWPGSEADIQGHHPDYWKPYDGKVTPDQRVDQVLAWLDLPVSQRPSFLTLYFDAVDHAGHEHGPDSPQVNDTLRETDAAMTRLVAGLKARGLYEHMNIIVVADHGMAAVPQENSILIDELIPVDEVDDVSYGVLAGFNPKPGADDAFHRVEAKLEQPQQHMQCWDKSRIPARFEYGHNARVPQVVCLADVGWRITTHAYLAKHNNKVTLGDHGYDNADPLMRALFVAHGPAFRQGIRVAQFPNVDVYPLMTHLLDVPTSPNDGSFEAVKGMLVNP